MLQRNIHYLQQSLQTSAPEDFSPSACQPHRVCIQQLKFDLTVTIGRSFILKAEISLFFKANKSASWQKVVQTTHLMAAVVCHLESQIAVNARICWASQYIRFHLNDEWVLYVTVKMFSRPSKGTLCTSSYVKHAFDIMYPS